MAYVYSAVVQYTDSDGRFANLTQSPTVTAYDLDGNAIASPSITNIATGTYKVSVTQNDLEDVVFRVVPHTDDQADFADVAVMQDKVTHTADEILTDTGTTIPTAISNLNDITADNVLDAIVEGTYSLKEVLRIMSGVLAGKLSGGGTTTLTFRDLSDTLNRIVATVDSSGNRSAITIDET